MDLKKKIKEFIKILLLVLFITIIVIIITDIAFIFIPKTPILKYFIVNKDQLESFILTITFITALIGVVYSAKLDRESQKHSESSWREKLLEFEQKSYYTIEDLFVLNSFINPYNKNGIDKKINEALVEIIIKYSDSILSDKEKENATLFNFQYNKTYINDFLKKKNISYIQKTCQL